MLLLLPRRKTFIFLVVVMFYLIWKPILKCPEIIGEPCSHVPNIWISDWIDVFVICVGVLAWQTTDVMQPGLRMLWLFFMEMSQLACKETGMKSCSPVENFLIQLHRRGAFIYHSYRWIWNWSCSLVWWWDIFIDYLCFLGNLFIGVGFCGIGHFIKWHQTLLMQLLMVQLEWSVAAFLQ